MNVEERKKRLIDLANEFKIPEKTILDNFRMNKRFQLSKKSFLQVVFLVISGWFGEWSFIVSLFRVFGDWLHAGYPRSYPRIVAIPPLSIFDPSFWYGITWRVLFEIGDLPLVGVGLTLLVALVWVFYELLKAEMR